MKRGKPEIQLDLMTFPFGVIIPPPVIKTTGKVCIKYFPPTNFVLDTGRKAK